MTTATTAAKVARVKASHPVTYQHGDHSDNRSAKGHVSMGLAAAMPALLALALVGGAAFYFWK